MSLRDIISQMNVSSWFIRCKDFEYYWSVCHPNHNTTWSMKRKALADHQKAALLSCRSGSPWRPPRTRTACKCAHSNVTSPAWTHSLPVTPAAWPRAVLGFSNCFHMCVCMWMCAFVHTHTNRNSLVICIRLPQNKMKGSKCATVSFPCKEIAPLEAVHTVSQNSDEDKWCIINQHQLA